MFLRRHDRSDRRYCSGKCRMRALRMRRGKHPGCRPRGRPARHPIPQRLNRSSLRRLASRSQLREEQAKQASADLQQRFEAQTRELALARAKITELERLLAQALGKQGAQKADGQPPKGAAQLKNAEEADAQQPQKQPSRPSDDSAHRPRPTNPRPGIIEVRRQLGQALLAKAALRTLVEELQRRVDAQDRRCMELEVQLERALMLAEYCHPEACGQLGDASSAAQFMERATILKTELEQLSREHAEIAAQRARLLALLTEQPLCAGGQPTCPTGDYRAGLTALFSQVRLELEARDRFAQWEAVHRPRESDRRLDPARTIDDQALVATLSVRWQLMDHAPQSFRHRPRWVVDGVLLDEASEQFLIKQSVDRMAYRQRLMAASVAPVT